MSFSFNRNPSVSSFHCDECGAVITFDLEMVDRLCDICRRLQPPMRFEVNEWADIADRYALLERDGVAPVPHIEIDAV